MNLIDIKSSQQHAKKYSGGKGYNLYLLAKNGVSVPNFFVIGADVFRFFKDKYDLDNKIAQLLSENEKTLEKAALEIEKLIVSLSLDEALKEKIQKKLPELGEGYVSVRSSALDEDSGAHSFAGQLSSFLYLKKEDTIFQSVLECWASAYSYRGLVYRQKNNIQTQSIDVAVVVQRMIRPKKSGVLFTCHPISGSAKQQMINSVYGTGEGLVSGAIEPDQFVVDKSTQKIEEKTIVTQTKMFDQSIETEDCIEVDVPEGLSGQDSISAQEVSQISLSGNKIESLYHFPQDIEWAIDEQGKLWILQSRPVTTEFKSEKGHLFMWDNSNIVESYGGVTLPLTFHFAHYNYHHVYVQFCEILLVPQRKIREMEYFLKNMLGTFYGRVYYNLINWYKLTSILPGYKFNRSFMETMMGTSTSLEDEVAERVKPPSFHKGPLAFFRKILVGGKFLYFHFNIQHVVDSFMKYFYEKYESFHKIDFSSLPPDQTFLEYQKLERTMLHKWHAPIINDFLCMVHYGLFKKLTEKWVGDKHKNIHNDLLAGNGNLESAMPTKVLIKMAGEVSQNQALKTLMLETPDEMLLEALSTSSEHQGFYRLVLDYLDKYGFRCMSEMKIEQLDFHLKPSLFFTFLKNIIRSGETSLETYEKREAELRSDAEKKVFSHIKGLKQMVYRWSLKNARTAVMNRENTRFCRTRVYGIVRRMFYGVGEQFVNRGMIDNPKDIFYLTLEEFKGCFEGTLAVHSIRKLIEVRKEEYTQYEEMDEPLPRFMTRGPVYWFNEFYPKEEKVVRTDLKENELAGIGCCPGVVEGVIKVINGPDDDLSLDKEILVTHRTDPGWIPLYPSISALLVERGGLLSHSAIVAREMGLPTIVSIDGLTQKLETGMRVRMDGESGVVEILS